MDPSFWDSYFGAMICVICAESLRKFRKFIKTFLPRYGKIYLWLHNRVEGVFWLFARIQHIFP